MANKARQVAVLEHWFGIDKILFGGNAKEVLTEEVYKNYTSTKGALLSNLYEIYKKVDYSSPNTYKNHAQMFEESAKAAEKSKAAAKKICMKEGVSKIIGKEIKDTGYHEGLTEQEVARYVIMKRRNAVAIDNMLMTEALNSNSDTLTDWKGKVLVDSHKTLRDAIIDISLL